VAAWHRSNALVIFRRTRSAAKQTAKMKDRVNDLATRQGDIDQQVLFFLGPIDRGWAGALSSASPRPSNLLAFNERRSAASYLSSNRLLVLAFLSKRSYGSKERRSNLNQPAANAEQQVADFRMTIP